VKSSKQIIVINVLVMFTALYCTTLQNKLMTKNNK